MTAAPLLRVEGLTKYFASSGVLAVDDVSLDLRAGEVLALVGENGTGKTTLTSMVFGLHRPDSGRVLVAGREAVIRTPQDAIALGIGMVQQHFALVRSFTVAENVPLGREPRRRGLVDRRAADREVARLAAELGMPVDPRRQVGGLPIGLQQRVEILRTLAADARVVILDEPTAMLTPAEARDLAGAIRRLAATGRAVLFISHKLPEVFAVADRIAVMRRGRLVGTLDRAAADRPTVTRMMIGREIAPVPARRAEHAGTVVLELRGVGCRPDASGDVGLRGVDLTVRSGEIVGVAGVSGNGQNDLVHAVTGIRAVDQGVIEVGGTRLCDASVRAARRAGVAHIPEDRMTAGLNRGADLAENVISTAFRRPPLSRHGVLRRTAVDRAARDVVTRFDVRGVPPRGPVATLSGGNLQKIVIGRELSGDPALLVANQPTRGLDVGSIEFVHRALRAERDRGLATLLVSTELDEVLDLSDRVAVLYDGRLFGPYPRAEVDRERVGGLMAGAGAGGRP